MRRVKKSWTNIFNLNSSAIAYCHLLFLLKGLLNLQVLQLICNVGIGSTVGQSLLLLIGRICVCYHGCQLCRWIPSLKSIIHTMKAINSKMINSTTYLTRCSWATRELIVMLWGALTIILLGKGVTLWRVFFIAFVIVFVILRKTSTELMTIRSRRWIAIA